MHKLVVVLVHSCTAGILVARREGPVLVTTDIIVVCLMGKATKVLLRKIRGSKKQPVTITVIIVRIIVETVMELPLIGD